MNILPKNVVLRRLSQLLLSIIALLLITVMLGAIYQSVSLNNDIKAFPPPGQLVHVNGTNFHIIKHGEREPGDPVIIIEAGGGNWSIGWADFINQFPDSIQIIAYDRAGYGWSDQHSKPYTLEQRAIDLHNLLREANIEPPFIIGGHSYGGYVIRAFAHKYPNDVAGLAFIESGHENQWTALPKELWGFVEQSLQGASLGSIMASLGIMRVFEEQLVPNSPLPEPYNSVHERAFLDSKWYKTFIKEIGRMEYLSDELAKTSLPDSLPIAVLAAADSFGAFYDPKNPDLFPYEKSNEIWMKLQISLSELTENSTFTVSENGTHNIQVDDPILVQQVLIDLWEKTLITPKRNYYISN